MTEAPEPVADRAATVQVLGVLSLVLLPFCGLGALLAVVALALARTERRERAARGAPPLPRGGVVCAAVSLALAGVLLVGLLVGLTLLVAGSTSP